MPITFNQFLSRIDEANIAGSRPRPQGRDVLTPAERASVSTRRNRSPIKRTGGGVSYVTVAPEMEKPKEPQKETPKQYVQKWIPGFPPPSKMKVKEPKPLKVTRKGPKKSRKKGQKPKQLELFDDNGTNS